MLARLTAPTKPLGRSWAVARTLIAIGGLLTVVFNLPSDIAPLLSRDGTCVGAVGWSVTCVVEGGHYGLVSHAVYLIGFAAIASGFLPVLTGPLHVWLAFGWHHTLATTDGGDATALVLAWLMLPICLVDWRLNVWSLRHPTAPVTAVLLRNATLRVFRWALVIQVATIYLLAGVLKIPQATWADGTAMHYWTNGTYFRPDPVVNALAQPLLAIPILLLLASWLPIALEICLGISPLLPSSLKPILFILGVVFHLLIGVLFGIWSFVLVMVGALILLLFPSGAEGVWQKMSEDVIAYRGRTQNEKVGSLA